MQDQVHTPSKWEQKILEKTLLASVTEQRRARRWGIFFKLFIVIYVLYATVVFYQGKAKPALKEHVALIDLIGEIGTGKEIEADHVAASLRQAFSETKVKGIILRMNSPGGTPVQSAYLYDEVRRLKKLHPEKKVYAVVVDVCASGAYYIAAAADQIYANASSVVGSIGVLMPNYGFVEVMKKIGVEQRSLAAGKDKLFLDPFSPTNPRQIEVAEGILNNIHQHFIDAVKEGRGQRLSQDTPLFTGLVWSGEQALSLGLIDGLGSAGFVAREVIGTEEIIDYTVTNNFFDRLASRFGAHFSNTLHSALGMGGNTYALH